jgi:isopentenyl-diphosphate delta-isomerase
MGLSPDLLSRLEKMGLEYANIAGSGGTNWVLVEQNRLPENHYKKDVAEAFAHWGEPTAEVLDQYMGSMSLIASGGINNGLSASIALAMGAKLVASAREILLSAEKGGAEAIIQKIETWQLTLKTIMFATGQASLQDFIGNTSLLRKI